VAGLAQDLSATFIQIQVLPQMMGVSVYPGFTEHAYRLVFPFEECFAPDAPVLLTVMPSGIVETRAVLQPKKEDALIAFTYPQNISDELAESRVYCTADGNADKSDPQDNGHRMLRDTAFVWRREDGTNALVQTWPTELNENFRKTFEITEGTNPDSDKFSPQAVSEFQAAMVRLFGSTATKCPIMFCHKKTVNTSPAVVGVGEDVLAHINENPELMRTLAILNVDSDGLGFVADGTSGDGKKFEKHFSLTAGEQCVVYRKVGWDTMGCIKPLHQFLRDADLQEPAISMRKDQNLESSRSMPNFDSKRGSRESEDRDKFKTSATVPNLDENPPIREDRDRCQSDTLMEHTTDVLHGHDQDVYRDYILRLWADTQRTPADRRRSLNPLLPDFERKVPDSFGFFGNAADSEDEWVRFAGISVLCLDYNKNVREAYKGRLRGREKDTAEDHFQSIRVWWKRELDGKLEDFLEDVEFVQALVRYRQASNSGVVVYRPRKTHVSPNDKHPRRDGNLHTYDTRSELLVIVQGSYLGAQDTCHNATFWTQAFPSVLEALDTRSIAGSVHPLAGYPELMEHSGYAEIVKELFPQVLAAIKKNNKPIDRIVVTGHSLGAAVGAGLVLALQNRDKYDLQAFLYAQPRSFQGLSDEVRNKETVLDIHNTLDPVVAASKIYKGLGSHAAFDGDLFAGDDKPKAFESFEY